MFKVATVGTGVAKYETEASSEAEMRQQLMGRMDYWADMFADRWEVASEHGRGLPWFKLMREVEAAQDAMDWTKVAREGWFKTWETPDGVATVEMRRAEMASRLL